MVSWITITWLWR